jgi:hypothetical protein
VVVVGRYGGMVPGSIRSVSAGQEDPCSISASLFIPAAMCLSSWHKQAHYCVVPMIFLRFWWCWRVAGLAGDRKTNDAYVPAGASDNYTSSVRNRMETT